MSAAASRGAPGQRPPKTKAPFGSIRKPMKKSQKRRQMTPVRMSELIAGRMAIDGRCAYADYGVKVTTRSESGMPVVSIERVDCGGYTEADHLLEQRFIRAALTDPISGPDQEKIDAALDDLRLSRAACQTHHAFRHFGRLLWPLKLTLDQDIHNALNEYGLEQAWAQQQGAS